MRARSRRTREAWEHERPSRLRGVPAMGRRTECASPRATAQRLPLSSRLICRSPPPRTFGGSSPRAVTPRSSSSPTPSALARTPCSCDRHRAWRRASATTASPRTVAPRGGRDGCCASRGSASISIRRRTCMRSNVPRNGRGPIPDACSPRSLAAELHRRGVKVHPLVPRDRGPGARQSADVATRGHVGRPADEVLDPQRR